MFSSSKSRGFTLIELLVVVAIIAMLASIVLASLNVARSKSRDAKRLSDIKNISTAVEEYITDNVSPPAVLSQLVPKYIAAISGDPSSGVYGYGVSGTHYCIGAKLEGPLPTGGVTSCIMAAGGTAIPDPVLQGNGENPVFVGS